MIGNLFVEKITEKAIEEVVNFANQKLKKGQSSVVFNCENIDEHIRDHVGHVEKWSSEISFKDLRETKKTSEVFIELDLNLTPARYRFEEEESGPLIKLSKVFKQTTNHIVILGQPGAGKTTSMKNLCNSIFFDAEFHPNEFNIPILIRLRDLNNRRRKYGLIAAEICNIFNIHISAEEKVSSDFLNSLRERFVINILDQIKPLIILDGFDELSSNEKKDSVLIEFSELTTKFKKTRMLLTSRTADFYYSFDNCETYEICPLSKEQIKMFSKKWLNDEIKSQRFLSDLINSPFNDTAIRPLNLAHLCAIYERVNKIPEKPKTVYRKIVNLLLEEWNEQRRIIRLSKYAHFEIDRKFEFLSELAFIITTVFDDSNFTHNMLKKAYSSMYADYELPRNESKDVINEIESHTGLVIMSGYKKYEFSHKSLQEYLAAEYIVKLPLLPKKHNLVRKIPNELAIAVAISSKPSMYFSTLVATVMLPMELDIKFIQTFINRIIIEKPSFNMDDKLGLSFVLLYSKYMNLAQAQLQQLNLFISDNLVEEFERFLDLIIQKTEISKMLKLYDYTDSAVSTESTTILKYKLKDKVNKFKGVKLPIELYVRKSFVSKFDQ